jgi:hypothetical protein
VIAYRLYNGNVLHIFTTGQAFALAASQGGLVVAHAAEILRSAALADDKA